MSPRARVAAGNKALRNRAPIFAALGDDTRLRHIAALCVGGAMSITRLTSGTDITRQAITKHLRVLSDARLVMHVKEGREVLYALDAMTGKELWNSGTTITSFAHGGAISGGMGQIYLGTYDGTMYAFGFPMEH